MDGRSSTILIALAFVGTGFAGCIESPEWFTATSAEVSALEYKGRADDAAAAWSTNAALVGVMAFELSESPDPRIDADPDPGNGLAPAWWYIYHDAEATDVTLRAFKVTSDGEVTSEKDAEALAMGFDDDMATPLGAWTVDSNEALATAKGDEGFAKVAQGFNATVVEGVAHHEDKTAWWVSAMSAEGFVVANVDAATGELLDVQSVDMDFEMPDFQWGAANPELSHPPIYLEGEGVAEPGAAIEFPFWTSGAPMSGTITIEATPTAPGENLWWSIIDENGEEMDGGRIGRFLMFGGSDAYTADVDVHTVEAAEYMLVIGASSWFPVNPLAQPIEFAFVLDLYPPGMDHEEEPER